MRSAVELAAHQWSPSEPDAEAPVAVLVHGVTGWHRTWWRVGPALAERGWRVIAVDQRGHGHSPRIGASTTVAELAEDLAATIEAIGPPIDALVGHSLGAAVSAELAFTRPELVRRLVLEDPPAVTRADDLAWRENLDREMRAARASPESEVRRELAENPTWLPEDARQNVEGRALADRDGLNGTFARDTGARIIDIAPMLSVPALYLLAAPDRSVFPVGPRQRLAESLPATSRLVVVEDAGHTIHRDRFEAYLEAVLDWIGPR